MKFRDPKTGEVFDVEREGATGGFCAHIDCYSNCPLPECAKVEDCSDWINAHPAEAARLMGYEVVEEKEEPMEKTDKPRICQVLGVEVGERFRVESCSESEFWVEDGALQCEVKFPFHWNQDTANFISVLLDAPEFIIRKPRFSQEEVETVRSLQKALSMYSIIRLEDGTLWSGSIERSCVELDKALFPQIHPGTSVKVEDILGGGS